MARRLRAEDEHRPEVVSVAEALIVSIARSCQNEMLARKRALRIERHSGRVTADPEITLNQHPRRSVVKVKTSGSASRRHCRLGDHPDRTRGRVSAVGAVFSQAQGCRFVESPSTTPTRCDGAEADRSGCLSGRVSDPGLVQAYCAFSGGGATCEAAAAPSDGLVSGSAKNLPTICATSGELMKL